jgi:hypothetical protein
VSERVYLSIKRVGSVAGGARVAVVMLKLQC